MRVKLGVLLNPNLLLEERMMGSRSDRMDTQAAPPRSVGMVLFEGVTQLDLTGPYEVFARMPNTQVHLLAATLAPVRTEWGLTITPTTTFDDASALDVLCVPFCVPLCVSVSIL